MIFQLVLVSIVGVCVAVPQSLGLPGANDVNKPAFVKDPTVINAEVVQTPEPDKMAEALCWGVQLNGNSTKNKNIIDGMYNARGQAQCKSLDHLIGYPIYNTLGKLWFGDEAPQDIDFGGKSVCEIDCDGTCEPYKSIDNGAPITAYPWGCKCNKNRCNANGPIQSKKWAVPITASVCQYDIDCSNYCQKMDETNPNYKGYICNWWYPSADNNKPLVWYDARGSPIKWCECCPQ